MQFATKLVSGARGTSLLLIVLGSVLSSNNHVGWFPGGTPGFWLLMSSILCTCCATLAWDVPISIVHCVQRA
jgi:hypothetical protein